MRNWLRAVGQIPRGRDDLPELRTPPDLTPPHRHQRQCGLNCQRKSEVRRFVVSRTGCLSKMSAASACVVDNLDVADFCVPDTKQREKLAELTADVQTVQEIARGFLGDEHVR